MRFANHFPLRFSLAHSLLLFLSNFSLLFLLFPVTFEEVRRSVRKKSPFDNARSSIRPRSHRATFRNGELASFVLVPSLT